MFRIGLPLYVDLAIIGIFIIIWISIVTFLWLKKKKSLLYLLLFSIFFIYLYKVLDYTLFQFQSLILLKYFMPDLMLRGQTAGENLNLIPLLSLTDEDVKTSLLNILLFIPFGFGLPFLTHFRMKKVLVIGVLFTITIEILQFVTGFFSHITFRVTDINDVIFNTVGVAFGYLLFVSFVRFFRETSRKEKLANTT